MKCKFCGETSIDIVEKQMSFIIPAGQKMFVARCPSCLAEPSSYAKEEDAKTKGVAEVFEGGADYELFYERKNK